MLGKLLKYELKATSRVFLPLYITLLVVALINSFFVNSEMFQIQGLLMMVFGALLIAMFVITFVVLLQRFSKNLLGDEGYLIFTLPVSSNTIILSKYLVALLWTVLSAVAAILAFFLVTIIPIVKDLNWELSYIFQSIGELFNVIFTQGYWPYAFNFILLIFLGYSVFIFTVYLALSMGQLPVFNKHRNLASFISFIALNILFSFVQNLLGLFLFNNANEGMMLNVDVNTVNGISTIPHDIISLINTGLISSTIFNLVLLIGLFFATKYILDRKLNLE
ncbi:ABC transporter permease [Romboutsia sp.]|uniref:ABC transporter permease n=1 Tax=Romboutsia sp. TaxID=1965302 RepID=UPI003F2DB332